MKRIRLFYQNLSLRTKLLISSIFTFVLLFLICAIIGLNIVDHSNRRLLAHSLKSSLDLSTTMMADCLNDIQQVSFQALSSSTLQESLGSLYYADKADPGYEALVGAVSSTVYDELTSLTSLDNRYISYMILETDAFTSRSSFQAHTAIDQDTLANAVLQAEVAGGLPVWIHTRSDQLLLARQIRETYNTRFSNFGTLLIGVDLQRLISDSSPDSFGENICLLYHGSELQFMPNELSTQDVIDLEYALDNLAPDDYRVIQFQNQPYFVVKGTIPQFNNWSYIHLVSYQDYEHALTTSFALYYAVILFSLLVSFILNFIIIKHIGHDLDNLMSKIQHFHGQEEPLSHDGYDYSERQDELGILHQEFDSMASNIQQLIHVNYTNELLMRDAQLKALEMQINPHFLYNTLESINWRAKSTGQTEISQMVEALGNLLRRTLSHRSQRNTLQEEIEIVQYFLTIMDLRFEDRLEHTIEADPCILDSQLPTLTIQPLVENAANYALEEMTDLCYIKIEAFPIPEDPSHICICVKNTGTEFEPDLLAKLKSSAIKPRGLGIGLLNIEERLSLTFGRDFCFDFYNEDDYAIARIVVPYRSARHTEG